MNYRDHYMIILLPLLNIINTQNDFYAELFKNLNICKVY